VYGYESEFLQSNAVVAQGNAGVLLIDPGITSDEMAALAKTFRDFSQPVGPDFRPIRIDHLLCYQSWSSAKHPAATARNEADRVKDFFQNADWRRRLPLMLPLTLLTRYR